MHIVFHFIVLNKVPRLIVAVLLKINQLISIYLREKKRARLVRFKTGNKVKCHTPKLFLVECNWHNLFHFSPSLFTFSYPCMVEKILFWSQIFEIEFLVELHTLISPESENCIFRKGSWRKGRPLRQKYILILKFKLTCKASPSIHYMISDR